MRETEIASAKEPSDDGGDKDLAELESDAVECRLRDAEECRDGARDAHRLELLVPRSYRHRQGGCAEVHVVGEEARREQRVVPEGPEVLQGDRDQGPMRADHDEERAERADEAAHQPRRMVVHKEQQVGEAVADVVTQRPEHHERDDGGDEHRDGEREEHRVLGQVRAEELLELRVEQHGEKGGNHLVRVGDARDGQAHHGHGGVSCHERRHRGRYRGRNDGDSHVFVAPDLLGGGDGHEDGQEYQGRVSDRLEHLVGRGLGRENSRCAEKDVHDLDESGAHEGGNDGGEDGGEPLHVVAGASLATLSVRAVSLTLGAEKTLELVVDLHDVLADDDLVLAVLVLDADDLGDVLDPLAVGQALVLELKTKTGDAVREEPHVVLAADGLENLRGDFLLGCHAMPLSRT